MAKAFWQVSPFGDEGKTSCEWDIARGIVWFQVVSSKVDFSLAMRCECFTAIGQIFEFVAWERDKDWDDNFLLAYYVDCISANSWPWITLIDVVYQVHMA